MYTTESLESWGEQFGGPLSLWHYHPSPGPDKECFASGFQAGMFEQIDCPENAIMMDRGVEMIHVWFIQHPEGPFASDMHVPSENLREPEGMSESEFKEYAGEKYEEYFNGTVENSR